MPPASPHPLKQGKRYDTTTRDLKTSLTFLNDGRRTVLVARLSPVDGYRPTDYNIGHLVCTNFDDLEAVRKHTQLHVGRLYEPYLPSLSPHSLRRARPYLLHVYDISCLKGLGEVSQQETLMSSKFG